VLIRDQDINNCEIVSASKKVEMAVILHLPMASRTFYFSVAVRGRDDQGFS
jgi:hypothetical protein